MTTILYPDGYGTARVTMAEMQHRHAYRMEPEYARRLFAWLTKQQGRVGIGGGWRTCPANVSQASQACESFHQTQEFADGFKAYCAVDLVVYRPGQVHRAPTWSEVPVQGSAAAKAAGVHANISNESWHMQPVEIDGFASWVNAGRKRPKAGYPITGAIPVTPPALPGAGFPPFDPLHGAYSLYPIATNKGVLRKGMTGQPMDTIRYFQGVCLNACRINIHVDGFFGDECVRACKYVQGWNGLFQSGVVDAATWKAIDAYAMR